jgi:hypothetical protein
MPGAIYLPGHCLRRNQSSNKIYCSKTLINEPLIRQVYMYEYYCILIYFDKHEYLIAYTNEINSR